MVSAVFCFSLSFVSLFKINRNVGEASGMMYKKILTVTSKKRNGGGEDRVQKNDFGSILLAHEFSWQINGISSLAVKSMNY